MNVQIIKHYKCTRCSRTHEREYDAEDCCLIKFALIDLKDFSFYLDLESHNTAGKFELQFTTILKYKDPNTNACVTYNMPTVFDFIRGITFWKDKDIVNRYPLIYNERNEFDRLDQFNRSSSIQFIKLKIKEELQPLIWKSVMDALTKNYS